VSPVILHLEDDPGLARLVRLGFEHLGFDGEFLQASTVAEALSAIQERRSRGLPLDLIVVDMNLPDGTGLEVVRRVKTNPAWAAIPVLVLSSEVSPDAVSEAYALGANCYLSKNPLGHSIIETVEHLYRCWIEAAELPASAPPDRLRELLGRGAVDKAQASRLYVRIAQSFAADPELAQFWLGLALYESNHSNLLSFLVRQVHESDLPSGALSALEAYVSAREASLASVERLAKALDRPTRDQAFQWALTLEGSFDPGMLARGLGPLFPKVPAATAAFAEATARYLEDLARRVARDAGEPGLRQAAEELLNKAAPLRGRHAQL
jgi:CheY-like chemotaxis protein